MPIELITGAPGNGKTLYTVWSVEKRRQAEGREVYYNGINDLNLPWIQFDNPEKWHELPDGAIIVMDEAQKLFRPRALTKEVPPYVSALETHRHHGHDIYLVTQHPTLIETNVRRLCETHKHLMRKFGAKWATVHEWKGVKENCDKTRKDSQTFEFKYPKEVFGWYKSAELHTVKANIPKKVYFFLAMPFLIGALVYFASSRLHGMSDTDSKSQQSPTTSGQTVKTQVMASQNSDDLYKSMQPRIPDLPWTAPRYDALTQPVRAPVIAGCMMTVDKQGRISGGFCLTQQGSKVWPSLAFLQSYHQNRMFIDFDPGPGLGEARDAQGNNNQRKQPLIGQQPNAIPSTSRPT